MSGKPERVVMLRPIEVAGGSTGRVGVVEDKKRPFLVTIFPVDTTGTDLTRRWVKLRRQYCPQFSFVGETHGRQTATLALNAVK